MSFCESKSKAFLIKSHLSSTNIATSLSAVGMTLDWSSLNSLSPLASSLLILSLGMHLCPPSQVTSQMPLHSGPTTPYCHTGGYRPHSLLYTNNSGKYGITQGGAKLSFGTICLLHTSIGAICGECDFGNDNIFTQT